MRNIQTFSLLAGLALGLASAASASAGGAATTPAGVTTDTKPLILDLSRFQKEKFVTGEKTNANWQTVVGRQVFDGVPFQIEGRGCVYGKKLGLETRGDTPTHPDFIGIQVGRKFDELHLLHATQYAEVEGQEIALIRLNYADGTKHEFTIRFGGHARDWQRLPSEEKELLTDPNSKIVWRAPGNPGQKATMRLFKSMLANPHPEKVVTTMDVVSTKHLAAYDLIAATAANHDPNRPVTPPVLAEAPERRFDGALTVRVTERASGKPVAGALLDPRMNVGEVSAGAIPVLTSATGEGVIRYPVGSAISVSVSVQKEGFASRQAALDLESSPTNLLEVELTSPPKLTGVVRDGAGAPLAGVELVLWPGWRANSKGATTDTNGHFVLPWSPQNFNDPNFELFLIARDLKRNLALAQTVDEETTNLNLRLEPGLTVTGRAMDAKGKPIADAEADVMFWTERMGSSLGKPTRGDAEGHFEIKALPPGRHYGVNVSAKGYGRVTSNVAQDAEGRRIELEPSELALADQRIAGVVLDSDDKPVANANLYGYGEGQPNVNGKTDAKGRFSFNQVCSGPIQINANTPNGGYGSAAVEGGDTNITVQIGVRETYSASRTASKVSGKVTDPDGKPAPKVFVSLFPSFAAAEKQTDSEGRFAMTFDPNQFGGMGATQPIVVARDPTRNLATALDLEEGATNASLRLEPALTVAGRITDLNGKAITNAQAQALFHTERMSSHLGASVRADADGRFEIKGLPPGRQYSINTSAKGFGQNDRELQPSDTATNRLELEPFQLMPANQRIAGVVLDDNDKPVVRASIYSYGNKQPNLNAQTDAKGWFSMDKVCAGPIQLSANNRGGGYGNVTDEGGDTNITIRISSSPGMRRTAPRTASLKGGPLPDLASLGLTPADALADQALLAVLIDAEQRPSRRALRLLGEQAAALKEKGVAVVVVHMGSMADDAFKAWKQEAALSFPVGCLKGDAEKARASWGAGALPWLILTDKAHRVTAEGFDLDDLDAKLKGLAQ
jgi:protocatechuate 3,4-dioxygenase beta subunit